MQSAFGMIKIEIENERTSKGRVQWRIGVILQEMSGSGSLILGRHSHY